MDPGKAAEHRILQLQAEIERLLRIMSRIAESAMPHCDPLSSEGAKVDYYMIAPDLFRAVCRSLHGDGEEEE